MKTLLLKWFVSVRLDTGRALPRWVQRHLAGNREAASFVSRARHMETALRQRTPEPLAPLSLHDSIMRRVRESRATPEREPTAHWLRWAPALGAAAVVILLALWWSEPPPTQPAAQTDSLQAVSSALALGASMPETAPAALVGPLTQELQNVQRDLRQATDFLFASIP